jgi:hypothetical protein
MPHFFEALDIRVTQTVRRKVLRFLNLIAHGAVSFTQGEHISMRGDSLLCDRSQLMFSYVLVLVVCLLCYAVHAFVPLTPPCKAPSTICAASKDLSVARREFVETCVIAAGAVAAAVPAAFAAPVESPLTEYSDPRYGFQFSIPSAWNKVSDAVQAVCKRSLHHSSPLSISTDCRFRLV